MKWATVQLSAKTNITMKSRLVNFKIAKTEDAETLAEKMKNIPRISLYNKPIKAFGKKKKEEEFADDKLFIKKELPKKLHHDKEFQAAKDLDDQILYISDPE